MKVGYRWFPRYKLSFRFSYAIGCKRLPISKHHIAPGQEYQTPAFLKTPGAIHQPDSAPLGFQPWLHIGISWRPSPTDTWIQPQIFRRNWPGIWAGHGTILGAPQIIPMCSQNWGPQVYFLLINIYSFTGLEKPWSYACAQHKCLHRSGKSESHRWWLITKMKFR